MKYNKSDIPQPNCIFSKSWRLMFVYYGKVSQYNKIKNIYISCLRYTLYKERTGRREIKKE